MATGGFINGNHSVHQSMLIKGPSLIWEGKFVEMLCWMTLATLIELPSSSLASSNSFQITAKPENYIVPRILEIRGVIASNYVGEFHSMLKAFMSDSKWMTQPGALAS